MENAVSCQNSDALYREGEFFSPGNEKDAGWGPESLKRNVGQASVPVIVGVIGGQDARGTCSGTPGAYMNCGR
jgi:hypothetical protein